MTKIKLSEYAKLNRIQYRAAWNRFKAGKIPNAEYTETGAILIDISEKKNKEECNVVYARVSTHDQKDDLERQIQRVISYANAKGVKVHKVIKEIASGLNDNRPKLNKILEDDNITNLIVENKDRLTRFGFNYIKTLFKHIDCNIIVVNEIEDNKEDLMQDFISIITSFCARIYSRRRSKNQVKKIIELSEKEDIC